MASKICLNRVPLNKPALDPKCYCPARMSQEVSKLLGSVALYPQYTPFISRWNIPLIRSPTIDPLIRSLPRRDILSCGWSSGSLRESFAKLGIWQHSEIPCCAASWCNQKVDEFEVCFFSGGVGCRTEDAETAVLGMLLILLYGGKSMPLLKKVLFFRTCWWFWSILDFHPLIGKFAQLETYFFN